ncbi:MAG TPA: type II secretion system minor pseudopilin GspJ [Gammaproteobacteria bacterium]|jgi:general secretion pathway protein J|nr:type II secretion system minor pseudopilin GspJ [Gammaproteobacteria bacterium]
MHNKSGFTLLEILMALFIFTIVSIMMVTTLHTVFDSQTVTAKNAEKTSKLQLSLLLMSRDFEQAIDRPITNAKNIYEGAFIGSPRTVTFTHGGWANPKGQEQRSTLQRTKYAIENHQLIRSVWTVLDQSAKTLPTRRVLYDKVSDLRFEYLDEDGKFQNNWPQENRQTSLPVAIRVSLTLEDWGKITQLYLLKGQNGLKSS